MIVFNLLIACSGIAIAGVTINACMLGLFSRLRSDAEMDCDGVMPFDEIKALYTTDPMRYRLHPDRFEFTDTGKCFAPTTTKEFLKYDSWRCKIIREQRRAAANKESARIEKAL